MVISQTPLRMSFAGGGSDLPAFYRKFGGAVVSTTVAKYVYVAVNEKFDHRIRLSYSKTEEVEAAGQLEHTLVRAVLQKMDIAGVEITSIADIPSRGTGMGSSSSFTIGLLHALHAYRHQYVSAADLATESCTVEIDLCGERIGKQDQYAAAFGGLNFIRFDRDDSVMVEPIICRKETLHTLEHSILTFYTGITRSASGILNHQSAQVEEDEKTRDTLRRMVDLAHTLRDELRNNNLSAFGEILHENWRLKREITSEISNPAIDQWYESARAAGAAGGKLLGAGGGGFLMFYAPPERHAAIVEALPELRQIEFPFDKRGSRIILYQD